MGLNQGTKGNRTYVSVSQGNFAKRVTESTEGAVKREYEEKKTKEKKVVYEIIYQNVTGMIENVSIHKTDFGDFINIDMSDSGEEWTVSLNCTTKEARHFMAKLPNIKLKEFVTLHPYNFEAKSDKTGKMEKRIGLSIKQGGQKVEYFYPLEDLPQIPEGADSDEFKLAMDQQNIWYKKKTKLWIEANFPKGETNGKITPNKEADKPKAETKKGKKKEEPIIELDGDKEDDGLPF